MATAPISPLTEEEYLRIERTASEKSEYHDGEMFAMSGGTPNHSYIGTRACSMLDRHALPPGCRAFNSDMRIKVAGKRTYLYADGGIICSEPEIFNEDNLLNPTLIVEVLSDSSEAYDRGKKFELYRSIPSFREYLLIAQDRRHVEHYSKQDDGSWLLREHSGAGAVVSIARWEIRIPLAELYATALNLSGE
jgi:Uma2 family endonuclease